MKSKTTYFLTRLIGTMLVFCAVSSSAAALFPFYVAGGLVHWPSFSSSVAATLQDSPGGISADSIRVSNRDTRFRITVGFSFNETWSVEASYIAGPRQDGTITDLPIPDFEGVFALDVETELEATVYRLNPVYEYVLRDPISVQLKAGIARIQTEGTATTTTRVLESEGIQLPSQKISESMNETKAFAASALKINFQDGKIAVVASLVQYYDPLEGLDRALELDLLWRF
ncbi:MAG: outer membrane beta-barrel protein [Gammaproteobacteria bacterium]|nr:outer membrane beta-barrel protein [Gammaproteobacteria bacterium]